jgi:hydroxypyruvate isomerase
VGSSWVIGPDSVAPGREARPGGLVRHVQIADVPGRHEPGTANYPIREFLDELGAVGYEGVVGLAYRPLGSTSAALSWLPPDARG